LLRTIQRTILHRPRPDTIPPLIWPDRREPAFGRHQSRPLRLTFDTASFSQLTTVQQSALNVLREFRFLDLIDALDTAPEYTPHVTFGDPVADGNIPLTVSHAGKVIQWSSLAGYQHRQLKSWAPGLARQADPTHPDAQQALATLMVLEAHMRLGRDILITESQWPFDPRVTGVSKRGNPRRILDAAKIVGLFLRSRDSYVYRVEKPGFTERLDRGGFYWALTRYQTPNMWRYVSACVLAEDVRKDSTQALGLSILMRCDRAVQARDRIGEAFYGAHGGGSRDEMMYHFDYLALLLAGALDSQARVAHRAYTFRGSERRAMFRDTRGSAFLKSIRLAEPALHAVVTATHSQALLTLLYEVRNTIHAASLRDLGARVPSDDSAWEIEVRDDELAGLLRNAAGSIGSLDEWGMSVERYTEDNDPLARELLLLEPYTFADTLLRRCLNLINEIAAVSNVELLLKGHTVPALLTGPPPDDSMFSAKLGERLALLG